MASDEFSGNYMEKHRAAQVAADFFPGTIRDTRHPGPGVFAFAAVVVLSLLASAVFDPHEIWEERA